MKRDQRRLTILDLLLLIAGVALALWLVLDELKQWPTDREDSTFSVIVFVLGGLSLLGPPLLLRERLRRRARLRLGEMIWFCQGTASWLLWPPVIVHRVRGTDFTGQMAPVCYIYGTPLMALYVTITLLAGGWLRPRRGRKWFRGRSWTDMFGLMLGLLWACTGLYLLGMIYKNDLFR
jgi:hypothetical protein